MKKEKEISYFQHRMDTLGVTEENNVVRVFDDEAEFPMPKSYETPVFSERQGNIEILITGIGGEAFTYYTNTKNPQPRQYVLTRLKEPKGDVKYLMPKGQGSKPFFPPALQDKYRKKEKIEKLFLTEGAFKAFKGSLHGLDVVGLSSITHYGANDENGKRALHKDIQRLIIDCQVEYVVVLWDGDCLNISKKDLLHRDELTKRPAGFFYAAKKIGEFVQKIKFPKTQEPPQVFFSYIKPKTFQDNPKGLDDLLVSSEKTDATAAVIKDAKDLSKNGKFFYKTNITKTTGLMYQHFGLDKPEVFYRMHGDLILNTEFLFKGDLVRWNDNENELETIAPAWAKDTRWIGDEFFVERLVPGANRARRVLMKRGKETLSMQHGKDFYQNVKFFDGFCNVPSHFEYEQVVNKEGRDFYNRYFPFKWEAKEGKCPNIIEFIKHIFGETQVINGVTGKMHNTWELGLDYMQIMLCEPSQILPVMCLYSRENNTGKSTFGKLQTKIFGDNVVQISNSDLQSDFNEIYSDKVLAICEETLLERKKDVERIKALSTSDQISVNPKGQRQFTIDYFCKMQFYSNNSRMIQVTKHDERFWIIEVPKPKKDNPGLLKKMEKEIPAFIHYLKNRKLSTERQSRMHFHYSLIRTKAFYEAVKVNEPQQATDIREALRDMFLQEPHLQKIEMPLKEVKAEFFTGKTSTAWVNEILKDYLNVNLKRDKDGKSRVERGKYKKYVFNPAISEIEEKEILWRGRPYVFHRKDYVIESEDLPFIEPATETVTVKDDTPF